MAYGFSDFDLRAIPTPKLLVPGDLARPYPKAYASVLGLAVDNIVKWVTAARGNSRMSFDAVGGELEARSVVRRLLYPRHLRVSVWRDRLGVPISRWDGEGEPEPRLSAEEVNARRIRWEENWRRTIVHDIVVPIIDGRADAVAHEVLSRYLAEFVFAPRLAADRVMLSAAANDLRQLLVQIPVATLSSVRAVIDANFGFSGGKNFEISAVEPDLLLDDMLLDVKVTMSRRVPRRLFEEMVRYLLCFVLQQFSEGEGPQLSLFRRYPSQFQVRRLGFYLADGGRLVTWDRSEWLTDEQLATLRAMFVEDRWTFAPRHQPHDRTQIGLFATKGPRRRPSAKTPDEPGSLP